MPITNAAVQKALLQSGPFAINGSLAAYAAGGQSLAMPLRGAANRITLATAPNGSFALPSIGAEEADALTVWVVNDGANTVKVFCAPTDLLNGTQAASLSIPSGTFAIFVVLSAALGWSASVFTNLGLGTTSAALKALTQSGPYPVNNGLAAFASGGQTGAMPLRGSANRITLATNTNASLLLPSIKAEEADALAVWVLNDSINSVVTFCAFGDLLNGVLNGSISIPTNAFAICVPVSAALGWTAAAFYAAPETAPITVLIDEAGPTLTAEDGTTVLTP